MTAGLLHQAGQVSPADGTGWVAVCAASDVIPGRAVCAIVEGRQVAVVMTADGSSYGLSNRDPFSGAFVLSRGIVGSRTVDGEAVPTLQSPMYKQAFDLRTGRCLDDTEICVNVYQTRVRDGVIEVRSQQG